MLREVTHNEIFTILIMVGLVCIAIAKATFANKFNDFAAILTNSKYLNIYAKDQKFIDKFDTLLFINFIISVGIFIYICCNNLLLDNTLDTNSILKLVIGTGLFFTIKVLLERLIGSVFDIDNIMDAYLFQKTSYKLFFGIMLIPINALLIYNITPSKTILYIILAVLLGIFLINWGTSLKQYQKSIKPNLFYFILYLCTLEIAPYIILYKYVSR